MKTDNERFWGAFLRSDNIYLSEKFGVDLIQKDFSSPASAVAGCTNAGEVINNIPSPLGERVRVRGKKAAFTKPSRGTNEVRDELLSTETLSFRCKSERCHLMRGAVDLTSKAAFTLAEMMVVLLILSITLAAMAPVMTTKAKHDRTQNSSPWRWVGNSHTHAYFGQNQTQMGMIGQKEPDGEDLAKLIINNTNNDYTHMLFKNGDGPLARLGLTEYSISLGSGKVADDVNFNTAFGIGALASNTSSDKNTAIGYYALNKNNGGEANVAVGDSALQENTTGVNNIAVGSNALAANTTAKNNVAIGSNALKSSADPKARNIIAIGADAMADFSGEGSYGNVYSIAIGTNALKVNEGGYFNTVIGHNAMPYLKGNNNIVMGKDAMGIDSTTQANGNIAIGNQALYSGGNSSGGNLAIGTRALYSAKNYFNTAIGHYALEKLVSTGNSINTAVGYGALQNTTTGSANTAVGHGAAVKNITGHSNVAIGSNASQKNTTGSQNVAVGRHALINNVDGHNNTAVGANAMGGNNVPDGKYSNNVAIGSTALFSEYLSRNNTEYSNNVAIGYQAITLGYLGNANIAIGTMAMQTVGYQNNKAASNVAIGHNALRYAGGNNNVAIGYQSMQNSGEYTYNGTVVNSGINPNNSVAVGYQTLYNPHNGNNTALGYRACHYVKGSNKTCIGYNSGPNFGYPNDTEKTWATDDVERIFIGSRSKFNNGVAVLEVHNDSTKTGEFSNTAVVINGNLLVDGLIFSSNRRNGAMFEYQSRGDNNGHTGDLIHFVDQYDLANHFGIGGTSTNVRKTSDRRLKYVGTEFKSGLDKIRQLKVFNYTFKKDDRKTPHVGVIAQDLQKVFPNAVTKGEDGFLMIRMEDMFYALINAVKELDARLARIEQRLINIEKQNAELKARLDKLERR